jgi:hypothetical protein
VFIRRRAIPFLPLSKSLQLVYVQGPHSPSPAACPCSCSLVYFSESQLPHTLHSLMDSYYNLGPLSVQQLEDNQATQMTRSHNTFQQPPGAEDTGLPTSTLPRKAEHSLRKLKGMISAEEGASQILSPSSINNPGDISKTSLYAPSSSSSVSPSRAYGLQASLPGTSQLFRCVPALRPGLRTFSSGYSFILKSPFLTLSSYVYVSPQR